MAKLSQTGFLAIAVPIRRNLFALLVVLILLLNLIAPQFSAFGAPILSIDLISWGVIGLDSNNVSDGPNVFPVGARVCNNGAGAATGLISTLVWDSSNSYINLQAGSLSTVNQDSLAVGECTDFYYNIEITRDANAYETTRAFHITIDSNETSLDSTPVGYEFYVEYLISQARNSVDSVTCTNCGGSAPNYSVVVGNTYTFVFNHSTAPNGYEQLAAYLELPNTIFRIVSVSTSYTAPTGFSSDTLYQDGCSWEPDPSSTDYLSCLSTGKVGGTGVITYEVEIIDTGGPVSVGGVIYDFSGSSYHYNSDYGPEIIVTVLSPTETPTPTNTVTNTATNSATNTATNTPVPPTNTATNTPIPPTNTATNTPVPPTNTATNTATNTPVPPTNTATNTATNTPVPPTNTATNTATNTPIPPTNTATDTPVPPTNTATNTPIPPTNTATNTPVPPTNTATNTATNTPTNTATNTPIPPTNTATNTPVPPTNTATNTPVPPTNTATNTPVPPTNTATNTPVPPTNTATNTPVPPTNTATNTPIPPTNTATNTPVPPTNTATGTLTSTATGTLTSTASATPEAIIVDPAVTKSGDPSTAEIGDEVVYTIEVFNNGNENATNVVVTDTKPDFLNILSVEVNPSGPTVEINGNTLIVSIGTVTPSDLFTITVVTQVNEFGQAPGGTNTVRLSADEDDDPNNNIDDFFLRLPVSDDVELPNTGFAPDRQSKLPSQPSALSYTEMSDLWLEVPSLGIEMDIVGIPLVGNSWDVSWLWDNAGYLEGTAFPTWAGNTGIAGHVTLPDGRAGPFAALNQLGFGDAIIIHAWGIRYEYHMREMLYVGANDISVLGHEDYDWVSLVTCRGYNLLEDSYEQRVVARAVLVSTDLDVEISKEAANGFGIGGR